MSLMRDCFKLESGLCACGCGQKTRIALDSNSKRGWIKGQPRLFLRGHSMRLRPTKSYRHIGGQREHVIRAENALGKPLPKGAVVHHLDGTKSPDAPLVICQDAGYHSHLHARMRVITAGGDPNTQKVCSGCKQVKAKAEFAGDRSKYCGLQGSCRDCVLVKHLSEPGKWPSDRRQRHSVVMRNVNARKIAVLEK